MMPLVLLTQAATAQTASYTCTDFVGRTSLEGTGHFCYELDESHPGTLALVGGGSCDDYYVTSAQSFKRLCVSDGNMVRSAAQEAKPDPSEPPLTRVSTDLSHGLPQIRAQALHSDQSLVLRDRVCMRSLSLRAVQAIGAHLVP